MRDFLQEFKAFAVRGNVIDLAVAVVIGAAFGKIVSSLVEAIIMPLIGIFLGGINLSNLSFTFRDTTLKYGVFLQNVVDFIIIAFVIFLVIQAIGRLKRRISTGEQAAPQPSEEIVLLREIRDLLKRGKE